MCTVYEWNDSNMIINPELFDKIVTEVSSYSDWIERVTLSRDGEPLMDRKIHEKIRKLKDVGIKYTTFSTNASMLPEKRAIELIESGLDDIRFSIDGVTKETFEKIRRGLDYDQVLDNCLRFIDLRNQRGDTPAIQIRMVEQEENYHEVEAWKGFWLPRLSKQDAAYSKPMHSWGNGLESYDGHDKDPEYSGVPCISPWSTMAIHADGKVGLCGCDFNTKVPMGDLNESTIEEVWQAQQYQRVRELHSTGKRDEIDLCIGCNIWDLGIKSTY